MHCALGNMVRVALVAVLWVSVTEAQTPTFSLEVTELNSYRLEEPTGKIRISPGDVLTAEIFIRDFSPEGNALRAYQAWMDPAGYTSGEAGSVEPVDFAITSMEQIENSENCFVDIADPRFVHAGLRTIALADSAAYAYRWTSILLEQKNSSVCAQDGTKYYAGTLRLRASDDAVGTFTLGLREETHLSALRDPENKGILPLDFEQLIIEVIDPSRMLRLQKSDPPDQSIDARQPAAGSDDTATGIDTLTLTFTRDTAELTPGDFVVNDTTSSPPHIKRLSSNGQVTTLVFDRGLKSGVWTTVTHVPSQTGTRIGFLPGDVNNDGVTNSHDLFALVATRADGEMLPPYRADINTDGKCGAADILRLIDLLGEPGVFRRSLDR